MNISGGRCALVGVMISCSTLSIEAGYKTRWSCSNSFYLWFPECHVILLQVTCQHSCHHDFIWTKTHGLRCLCGKMVCWSAVVISCFPLWFPNWYFGAWLDPGSAGVRKVFLWVVKWVMASRQWRGGVQHDLGDYDEEESSVGTSGHDTANSEHRMKGSIGPPPGHNGDRSPGAGVNKLPAKSCLHSTNLDPLARGPWMLQALTGKAFESVKHLIEDDSWCNDPDNRMQLLKLFSKPDYFGKNPLANPIGSMGLSYLPPFTVKLNLL